MQAFDAALAVLHNLPSQKRKVDGHFFCKSHIKIAKRCQRTDQSNRAKEFRVTERENEREMETCELAPEKRGELVSEWVSE